MILSTPLKRATKFSVAYALYLAIVWLFDYVYYPWLAIKFRYWMIVPLFPSIFLVSWGGYYLYEYFQEDVFFIDKINAWLGRDKTSGASSRIKSLITDNPRWVFAAVATWWSPLHAYVFSRKGETFHLSSFLKVLARGSLFCALFWGVVAESFLFLWHVGKLILR